MKINVNDKVRLKLTEHGKIILTTDDYLKWTKPDDDGWLELHLWEAMFVFGPFMFNGNPNIPFETNIELKASMTDEMMKRAIEAYAKDTGAEGFQIEGWIEPAMRAVLKEVLK